jgi:hypothetical protein
MHFPLDAKFLIPLKGNHALGLMRFAEENKHKDKEKIAVNND